MKHFAILLLLATAVYAKDDGFPPLPPLPIQATLAPSTTTSFTFAVAGDNRPDKCCAEPAELAMVIADMKAKAPAFVIWGGDTISGKDASTAPGQYTAFLQAFNNFGIPVYNAPGNHELAVKGTIDCAFQGSKKKDKMIDQPDTTGDLLTAYETSFKTVPYGVFRYGNAAFIAVNTDDTVDVKYKKCAYNGFVSKTQRKALETTLADLSKDATVSHIFLFMHRPLHDINKGKINSHQLQPWDGKWNNDYGQALQKFINLLSPTPLSPYPYPKVTVIFASHDHRFYAYPPGTMKRTAPSTDGPTFLITGGAGAPLSGCPDDPKPGAFYNYLLVNVDGSNVTVTVQQLGGVCGGAS